MGDFPFAHKPYNRYAFYCISTSPSLFLHKNSEKLVLLVKMPLSHVTYDLISHNNSNRLSLELSKISLRNNSTAVEKKNVSRLEKQKKVVGGENGSKKMESTPPLVIRRLSKPFTFG